MPRRRQRLLATAAVGALVVTGIGLSATRANAVVTGTTITSSSFTSPFTMTSGSKGSAGQNAPALQLQGTYARSGTSSDGVDSLCYSGTTSLLIGTQSYPSNGSFTVSGTAPQGSICDLRAVPTGTAPSGGALASYPALRQAFDYAGASPETAPAATPTPTPSLSPTDPSLPSASPSASGPFSPGAVAPVAVTPGDASSVDDSSGSTAPSVNASTPVHLDAGLPQATALVTLGDAVANGSAPTGGVTTALLDGSLDQSAGDVFAGAGVIPSDGATTSKSQTQQGGIRIDGVNVLTPGAAADIWGTDGNQPSFGGNLTVTSSINGQTGDATVTTSEPLLVCPDTSLPATKTTCPSFAPVGVTLNRVVTTSMGGRITRVTDTFTSPAAHSIALDYEHQVDSTSTGSKDAGPEFSTDGGESFTAGVQGTSIGLPAAPFSVLIKTSGDATSFSHPAGSVTYSTQPSSAVFANNGTTLVTHYDRSIPAGGAFTLTHSYVSSDSDAEVSSLSQTALTQGIAPSISLAVLPSVSTQNISLAGVVTDGQNGLPLTVLASNGMTAPVDQLTGIFAMPAVLKPGPQTVAVSGVDDMGQVATASMTVSYDNPLTAGRLDDYLVFSSHIVTAKKLVGKHMVTVRARVRYVSGIRLLVPLHCSSTATSVCTTKIKITSKGKTLKTVLFSRGPGYRPIVTIPLLASSYGSAGYNAAHDPKPTKNNKHPRSMMWSISVTVTYLDPDGSPYPGAHSSGIRI